MDLSGIKLVRVDFRLIHGQVITKWRNTVAIDHIVVVNDELAMDLFMAGIYTMAAPPDISVKVMSKADFIVAAQANEYAKGGFLMLFKNIPDVAEVVKAGVNLPQLQIGGLGSGNGRTMVVKGISVDKKDIQMLSDIEAMGTPVTFQVTPEESRLTLAKAKEKVR